MAARLSLREKIEIIRLLGDDDRSSREVCRVFNERHADRPNITCGTVNKIKTTFNETGAVSKLLLKSNHRQRINQNNENILEYFRNNPNASLRNASFDLDVPRETIRRCLKANGIKPFKPKFLHTLQEGDNQRRLEYCLWSQGEYLNNRHFLKNVLFTDEATFTTNGVVSSQNCRYWSAENPHWVINCKSQYSQKVNVWCGILNQRIIGPFFFEENMNAQNFLHFLDTNLWDSIQELPLNDRLDLFFQLDGCPVHYARIVREWLNDHFPNRWIGRGSPLIEWPPRSPDLTSLDFFLWGFLTQKVYKHRPRNREELCARIRQACEEITPQQLRNVTENIRKRYDKCVQLNGGLVEATRI